MGRRIALLVATDGYADPGLNQLRAPGREADQLARLLEDPAVGRFDLVRVLLNRPKAEVEEAVEELLTDRAPDDLVLLYFACHGLANDADRLFFATVDTRLSRRNTTAIRASFVHDLLDECEAAAKIVLLDCCFSGLFTRDLTARAERRVDVEREVVGKGTFVLTSTTSLAYAYEGTRFTDNGEPASVFTAAVIEGLRTGAADADRDGVITPDELYGYVFDAVVAQLGEEQKPTKKGSCSGRVELAYATAAHHGRGGHGPVPGRDGLILADLLPPPVVTTDQGLRCEGWPGASRFEVPVGRIEHRGGARTVTADLAGRAGHAAVVGRTGSGKTTLLRTLLVATALTHTPDEAEFLLLEGGVNGLGVLRGLPHVRQVAAPHETDTVGAVLAGAQAVADARQSLFRSLDLESADDFRALRASRGLPPGRHADIFLVIDGWLDFALTRPALAHEIQRIANVGLYCGVHVMVSARQWDTLPGELLSVLETRYELALDDPGGSRYDPVLSATLSTGRGLADGRPFRIAAPRMVQDGGDREALGALGARITAEWAAPPPAEPQAVADPLKAETRLAALLGIAEPAAYDPGAAWQGARPHGFLRVPVGVTEDGGTVLLDLKDGAQGGAGPHGVCVGATGSGKSELMRTVVMALALTHPPEEISFALIDYKGAAAFAGFGRLPHTSALMTSLAEKPDLVTRMEQVLTGEMSRRQEMLRESSFATVGAYEQARWAGVPLPPLPRLLVVIDDYDELLTAWPSVGDVLRTLARAGRSVGIHLLMGAQRLGPPLRGDLIGAFGYRIALRAFSPADSAAVLGSSDAASLPPAPGSGYLLADGAPTRFRAAFASYTQPFTDVVGEPRPAEYELLAFRMAGVTSRAHRMWLPPLDAPASLAALLTTLPPGAPTLADPAAYGRLRAPVGQVDRPADHTIAALVADLSSRSGHLAVVGGPQSGKTTLVSTLLCSLALTHTPRQVRFLCLDFGGGDLGRLADLPHVGGTADRVDPERVVAVVEDAVRVWKAREERLSAQGGHRSPDDDRAAAGAAPGGADDPGDEAGTGDLLLVIDGWQVLRKEFEQLEEQVESLLRYGSGCGIHVVVTANGWRDIPRTLHEQFSTRYELRLTDPADSELGRSAAAMVPTFTPGRGITADAQHFRSALPRIDGAGTADGLGDALGALAEQVGKSAPGPAVRKVRVLPSLITLAELHTAAPPSRRFVPLGVAEGTLAPVGWDFTAEQHLLIYGAPGSGRTNALRVLARGITAAHPPDGAMIAVVDYRGALADAVEGPHLLSHAASRDVLKGQIGELCEVLRGRASDVRTLPRQATAAPRLPRPEAYVLVDDYDMVAPRGDDPFTPLAEFLPVARQIGLHLVVVRSAANAATWQSDALPRALSDAETGGILLSADRAHGPLFATARPRRFRQPGRAEVHTRGRSTTVQLAQVPPGPVGFVALRPAP
ncbi:type VII secretion protein EccCb [Streptomyces sp. NBC_01477]|uniref:type VII secretion protein EccCb n=1 Tax=Streptomyces sp. NBC_01477 TaxID=2976015 RepID=UPI002E369D40|nr:type VII secretion protein EccCb [Streptomyces sp. NBC_01477]